MREINFNFNAYHNAKRAIDKLLMRGIKKFPDSVELRMLVTKTNHEFNLAWPDFSTSDDSDEGQIPMAPPHLLCIINKIQPQLKMINFRNQQWWVMMMQLMMLCVHLLLKF